MFQLPPLVKRRSTQLIPGLHPSSEWFQAKACSRDMAPKRARGSVAVKDSGSWIVAVESLFVERIQFLHVTFYIPLVRAASPSLENGKTLFDISMPVINLSLCQD